MISSFPLPSVPSREGRGVFFGVLSQMLKENSQTQIGSPNLEFPQSAFEAIVNQVQKQG
jgi:hypothetical protein